MVFASFYKLNFIHNNDICKYLFYYEIQNHVSNQILMYVTLVNVLVISNKQGKEKWTRLFCPVTTSHQWCCNDSLHKNAWIAQNSLITEIIFTDGAWSAARAMVLLNSRKLRGNHGFYFHKIRCPYRKRRETTFADRTHTREDISYSSLNCCSEKNKTDKDAVRVQCRYCCALNSLPWLCQHALELYGHD